LFKVWFRARGPAAVLAAVLAGAVLWPLAPASAVSCAGAVRYAASTNTVYLESGTATLADIVAQCPSAPLVQTDSVNKVWQLDADLVVQNGATLTLTDSVVKTLRLRSPASAAKTDVSTITAMYGTITIDHVTITSWDPAANGPDTDPSIPAGAAPDARGRAFIRAVSYLDPDNTPRESTMTITDSDLGYLGYYAAESYGVSYKGRGYLGGPFCDSGHTDVCDAVSVYGSETGSHFHNNWMGTYTFNAEGMTFSGNEYDHNVMYGLDPHDDSDHLTITGNESHDNGDHGIICSQRCNGLVIRGNRVWHNGDPVFAFPGDTDLSDNQIHGIMIHRGVTDTVIEDNIVTDHPNGAGIAVFDSSGNTIRNNTIDGAKYGLRISVGSAGNTISGNTVRNSGQYGVFTYQGTDVPNYTTSSGRPTGNTFTGNTFDGAGSNLFKINDSDGTTFTGNTVTGTVGSIRAQNSTGTTFSGNTLPSGVVSGSFSSSATTVANITTPTKASVDSTSTATFTNTNGTVYDTRLTTLTPAGGSLLLDAASAGTSTVTVIPRPVQVMPTSGIAKGQITGWGGNPFHIRVQSPSALTFHVGGLVAGAHYQVTAGSATITTAAADSSGTITFATTPPDSTEIDYQVTKVS
jgi:parallel beta-helix repeat protein